MNGIRCLIIVCLLFLGAVTAHADDGVAIEVVNKTGKELTVRLSTSSWDGKREISRVVAKDGTVRFSKSETTHKEGALVPKWEITFHDTCEYIILSNNGQCPVQVGKSSCASISEEGDSCSLRFVVVE